ncbi:MAG: alpha-L-rhamnosidase N-terminal domain-containing protein [Candidatus Omnitrophica bacterium]|nr:alpha-L-rhamnosidase N-terminal domain-containing protein [Candidatus Omnitrophota bacterium]
MTRREFIKNSAMTGSALLLINPETTLEGARADLGNVTVPGAIPIAPIELPDLSPARWLWYPSGRCLQNTFVLFRREVRLGTKPRRATGWIAADSRYLLEVNGKRVQWGPAPSDPRWAEADPMDLTEVLEPGVNVIGVTVLFYGQGDGTWPMGKPGFLFRLEIENDAGAREVIASDAAWKAMLARAWRPGHYKRWYLRALQEEFDARLYPYGWTTSGYQTDSNWLPALELAGSPNKPSVCTSYYEYQFDIGGNPGTMALRPRRIPLLREVMVPVKGLAESNWVDWQRTPEEYFECRPPNSFREIRQACAAEVAPGTWEVALPQLEAGAKSLTGSTREKGGQDAGGNRGAALTFELEEQVVGWPYFTIEAPEGTVIELMVQEAHRVGGPVLLNSHFDSWARFVCREGENRFETFDYESCRWIQLHIHGVGGKVQVRDVGVRRRLFPWPNQPRVRCGEPALQRLMDASINTLNNSAQETCVDGMGRERQQYSGDCGHQLHAIHLAFGETRLPARYLATFSQGITLDGYFLDCWPAYDRLARLMERQLQLTDWGPILDHGIQFNFDCWQHYLYTGDLEALKEPYPRLLRFAKYLKGIQGRDGLLPVENLGIPSVWVDHIAYQRQRHKQCAFNLYAAAMFEHALAPICRLFGDSDQAQAYRQLGRELLKAAIRKFWSPQLGLFVNNLPWLPEEKGMRLCDRSLATAILFDQCPKNNVTQSLKTLADCPPEMGLSYPANAGWRLWALAKGGRADVVMKDLRERWATKDSVLLNRTLQEDWKDAPDSGSQWSHCALAPLYVMFMSIAGIRPLEPGFRRCEIRPQLADLERLDLVARTVQGPIEFTAEGPGSNRSISIGLPPGCEGELLVNADEGVDLEPMPGSNPPHCARFRLPAGKTTRVERKERGA